MAQGHIAANRIEAIDEVLKFLGSMGFTPNEQATTMGHYQSVDNDQARLKQQLRFLDSEFLIPRCDSMYEIKAYLGKRFSNDSAAMKVWLNTRQLLLMNESPKSLMVSGQVINIVRLLSVLKAALV